MEHVLLTSLLYKAWSALAQTLIWGIVLVAAVRLTLAVLAPALNAATRFAIWFVALLAVVAMPGVLLMRPATSELPGQPVRAVIAEVEPAPSAPAATPARAAMDPVRLPATQMPENVSRGRWLVLPLEASSGLALLLAYGFVAGLLLLRLIFSYFRVRHLKTKIIDTPPEALSRFAKWRERCPTNRPVSLLISRWAKSPMAVGFLHPAIILPESLLLRLTGEEFDYLGLHEFAHLRRGDDWTNLFQRLVQAIFFFNPAVHWICARLEFEREVACDDEVLQLSGAAGPYARSLVKILELAPWRRGPILASGAVFRKRQILRRIETLFDTARNARPRVSSLTVVVIIMCVFGALSEIVRLPDFVAFAGNGFGSRHHSRWTHDGRTTELDIRGDVQFAPDAYEVQSIAPGGYVVVRESSWMRRELQITAAEPGPGLKTRYFVDGRERPLDGKGREWSTAMLAHVIRESGIQAEERAVAIYQKRGAGGVLDEIDRIGSDHSRRKYITALLHSGKLNTEDLRRVMTRVNRLGSDHEKAELLIAVADKFDHEALRPAYFDAVGSIHSDHDTRRVLTHVIRESGNGGEVLAYVGRRVERMGSDHDKSEILKLPDVTRAITAAGSATPRRAILRATERIQSSNDKANVLAAMLERSPLPPDVLQDIIQVAGTIESDHDRSRVLSSLVSGDVPKEIVGADLARTVEKISSDHEKANVLIRLASAPPAPAFESAVRSINSDDNKRRVLEAMLERGNSPESAKSAAKLAATLASDNDKSEVLEKVAAQYGNDPEIRDLVRRAADKIASDNGYRRVISRLLKEPPGDSNPRP